MQALTKKEVSCKALELFFHAAKVKNLNESVLLLGIPYELAYLKNRRERVEWWVYCKMVFNLKPYCSDADFEEMGSSFVKRGSYFEGLLWAFFLFTSSKFSRFLVKSIFQIGASMFSCMKQQTEFFAKNKIRITAFVEEDYEYCPEFFFMCKGVWEELGSKIGQKNFRVVLNIKDEKGVFDISWNKESILFKLKRQILWIFNIRKALLEVTDAHELLLRQYENLETSQMILQKQTTQLKTAYEISTSIRQSIDIKDTLKGIADALVKEAGFMSVYIDLNKDIDENNIDIKYQAGSVPRNVKPIVHEINIDGKFKGDLIAFPNSELDYRDIEELVNYITPVINISIHDALVLRAVSDYKDNLEQKVSDRTFELQKARDELTDTNELLKEAQQAQNRFFTNISHEFRTPLTLILGPSKQLSNELKDEKTKTKADLIHRSAKKLNRLVDELLDISKIESGEMKLNACPVNLVSIVKELAFSFSSLAERKKITFNVNNDNEKIITYLDKDKFDKILSNVLANAFKFTPEGGKIEVRISQNKKKVEITISDTGTGIPKNQINKIFDRFYQVDGSHTREHEGTGIGLALTKELVELHKGRIIVESEEGKGSTFRLIFPLGKDHLKPEEICEEEAEKVVEKDKLIPELDEFIEKKAVQIVDVELSDKPVLLIVEDNPDVRKYISMILGHEYRIFEAKDGEEGLDKSFEFIPDLIISDIMMPKLDGFKMCSKLKTDSRTSHIPVIMLTAKATTQDKVSGLEIGADDYIMKPFEEAELKARIKNLIEQRKRLQEHFRKYGLVEIEEKNITPVDQKFLQKVLAIINEHLSDTSFGVETLADSMAVSRSLLLKKVNALIGESPSEFIKRTRLNKAARLIEKNSGNISEIALEVGFSNPSYFAECFKKQFGVAPSQYQSKNK